MRKDRAWPSPDFHRVRVSGSDTDIYDHLLESTLDPGLFDARGHHFKQPERKKLYDYRKKKQKPRTHSKSRSRKYDAICE